MARLIDPAIARAVARRVGGDPAVGATYLMERLVRDLTETIPRSEELVAEYSGIRAPGPVKWAVIDRARWVEANIEGMTRLLAPLADRLSERLDALPLPVRLAQRVMISTEAGVLLGYVSRRVLGQYDLLVPEPSAGDTRARREDGGAVYVVGANIVETERRYGFVPYDFAFWVALHEVTHRFQFAGVDWLRPRFLSLVQDYLSSLELDARTLARRLASAAGRLMSKDTPPEERNAVYLLASRQQRGVLDQIQALMAVVEGHGNYVMDLIGAREIPSFRRMRRVFQHRRESATAVQRAVNHALGLELKLRQYELGQAFCERVVAQGGNAALARLWQDPESFPSMEELKEPDTWMRRVA
jgi:coenzyme F420 biosynthesis associated uncharacterized protein